MSIVTMTGREPLVVALPKGRILEEAMPIVRAAGIEPASTLWWTPVAAEAAALPMMKLLSTWENKEH